MLRRRDWLMIQERIRQGVYVKDIAAELGPADGEPGAQARRRAAGTASSGPRQQTGRLQAGGRSAVGGGGVERGADSVRAPRAGL